jgi:phosphoglycerate dehydrogenase-like enzyme
LHAYEVLDFLKQLPESRVKLPLLLLSLLLLVCRHPKVLALPHMGSATHEVYERMAKVLCHNIVAIREGGELMYRLC